MNTFILMEALVSDQMNNDLCSGTDFKNSFSKSVENEEK